MWLSWGGSVVSRRTVLAVSAGTAAGAMVPGVTGTAAVAGPTRIPETLAGSRAVRNGRLRVSRAEFRLTHLSVQWHGPAAQVRFNTPDGWTRWQTASGCSGGRDGHRDEGGSVLLAADDALGYEVWVAGSGAGQVTEINTLDGSASTLAAAAVAAGMPVPDGTLCDVPYLSRAAWGADESLRDFDPDYYPVQTITVHHTATTNNDANPAATVRAIYHDQAVTKGWGDIGYHFMIDEAGRVYEARWSGTDIYPAFSGPVNSRRRTTGWQPRMATGAHVGGYNSGNIGVCLIGNFMTTLPTAAAQESLIRVLTSLARACRLDPLATVNYVNPVSGAAKTVKAIPGHRNWDATACPGDLFYPKLPAIRDEVARRVGRVLDPNPVPALPPPPRR
jgi:hypothetical protein